MLNNKSKEKFKASAIKKIFEKLIDSKCLVVFLDIYLN